MSKSVTAVIAAQLVAEGKLSLDAPVGGLHTQSEFPSPMVKRITIRQLLNHRSGLPNPGDSADNAPPAY